MDPLFFRESFMGPENFDSSREKTACFLFVWCWSHTFWIMMQPHAPASCMYYWWSSESDSRQPLGSFCTLSFVDCRASSLWECRQVLCLWIVLCLSRLKERRCLLRNGPHNGEVRTGELVGDVAGNSTWLRPWRWRKGWRSWTKCFWCWACCLVLWQLLRWWFGVLVLASLLPFVWDTNAVPCISDYIHTFCREYLLCF